MKLKLVHIIVSTLLLSSVSFAQDSAMLNKMTDMRNAMNTINDGFFYNNKKQILEGLDNLENANSVFSNIQTIKKMLNDDVKHMAGVSYNNARKINLNIENMKNYVNSDKLGLAANSYIEIMNSCTSCHVIIRKW